MLAGSRNPCAKHYNFFKVVVNKALGLHYIHRIFLLLLPTGSAVISTMDRPHRRGLDYNNVDLFKPNDYLKEYYPYPEPGAAEEGQLCDAMTEILSLMNTK